MLSNSCVPLPMKLQWNMNKKVSKQTNWKLLPDRHQIIGYTAGMYVKWSEFKAIANQQISMHGYTGIICTCFYVRYV